MEEKEAKVNELESLVGPRTPGERARLFALDLKALEEIVYYTRMAFVIAGRDAAKKRAPRKKKA